MGLNETLAANGTNMRSFISVNFSMYSQTASSVKGFITHFTREWFQPSMNNGMTFQSCSGWKSLITFTAINTKTLILLIQKSILVHFLVGKLVCAESYKPAFKWSFSCVCPHMLHQMTLHGHCFSTNVTHVWFFFGMSTHMITQIWCLPTNKLYIKLL